jgi:drug/metabolite transporter (DMT)-like permease
MLAFTVLSWASAFPVIRIALSAYGPAQLALFRYLVAGAVLLGIGAAARLRLPPLGDTLRMALLGALGIAAYSVLLGFGQRHVPAGSASLLVASAPIWMVGIAAALGRERPSPRALSGVAVSFAGVVLIASGSGKAMGLSLYAGLVLAAAVATAAYNVLQRPLVTKYGPLTFTIVAVWGAAFSLLPAAPGLASVVRAAPAPATLAVLYLAVVPGALGYIAWSSVLRQTSAAAAGSALYLIPAVSMVLSNLMLGEVPSLLALAGGALVLLGVMTVHGRFKRPAPRMNLGCVPAGR